MLLCSLLTAFICSTCPVDIPDENTVRIKTPALQERQVAKMKLCNGLEALIISDPGADQSAAALSVTAGSWLDGPEYPGIAHFLEHLLFLGTKKYPKEDEFMEFTRSNGGMSNACTASDMTCYMFSVNHNAFREGLDRFADFFVSPIFTPSGVGREVQAVDQENSKNIQQDFWRYWMVLKETGNPKSPNASFSVGNLETIGKIPPEEVRKWWIDHYSAADMHLIVYSNQSIATLKKWVVTDFSPIEKRKVDNQLPDQPILSPNQLGHMIYIEPVLDQRSLLLAWELPKWAVEDLGGKLPQQIGYVLSNSTENSLETALKKAGLAESVDTGLDRLSPDRALWIVQISLTPDGVKQIQTVTDLLFQALAGLKQTGVPKDIFSDLQQMALINYEWQTRENAFQYVMRVARSQLPYEPLSTYPDQTLFYTSYQPKKLHQLINLLTPENCSFALIAPSKLTGVQTDHTEKWYGAHYAVRPFSVQPQSPSPAIGLPKPNPFIPTDLKILPKTRQSDRPVKLSDDAFGTSYYTQAAAFQVPEIDWTFSIKTPQIDGTPTSTAMLDLYIRSLYENLSSTIFYASYASLDVDIDQGDLSLKLHLFGFSEKADVLLKTLLDALKTVHPTEKEFKLYKESLLTTYANDALAPPYKQTMATLRNIITNDAPTPKALHAALTSISYQTFLDHTKRLYDKVYVESLFAGNLTQSQAEKNWNLLETELKTTPYTHPKQLEFFLLDPKRGPYAIRETTPMQGNAALLSIQQGPSTYQTRAAHEILGTALASDFFKTLRTKQQTGYIVYGFRSDVADQLIQNFLVQSSSHSPDDLLARYELFLETFLQDFSEEFPESRFREVRDGVVTTFTNPPTNLNDYASRQYAFAFKRGGDFDYLDNVANAAKNMTYAQAQTYATQFFSRTNTRRIAILLEGAPAETPFLYRDTTPEAIRSDGQFVEETPH